MSYNKLRESLEFIFKIGQNSYLLTIPFYKNLLSDEKEKIWLYEVRQTLKMGHVSKGNLQSEQS